MKKTTLTIKSQNGNLDGILTTPDDSIKGCLVCLHGGPGGDLHGNTGGFDELSTVAALSGYATIQFSFYGNGESDGEAKNYCIRTQMIDYEAVIRFIKSSYNCPIHVVGESAGATIASHEWRNDISSYILLWPAFDLKDTDLEPLVSGRNLAQLDYQDFILVDGTLLGAELIKEVLETNFGGAFNLPHKPVFIAHGQADEEVPHSQSVRAIQSVKSDLHFLSLPNAGHGFKDRLDRNRLMRHITLWLDEI